MASIPAEDGAESLSPAVSSGLGFDVKVFEQYLGALLPPGESSARGLESNAWSGSQESDSVSACLMKAKSHT